jgi:hypothetical protein
MNYFTDPRDDVRSRKAPEMSRRCDSRVSAKSIALIQGSRRLDSAKGLARSIDSPSAESHML